MIKICLVEWWNERDKNVHKSMSFTKMRMRYWYILSAKNIVKILKPDEIEKIQSYFAGNKKINWNGNKELPAEWIELKKIGWN